MKRMGTLGLLLLGLAFAAPATAGTLPSRRDAVATATAWRTAILAVPCERPSPDAPFVFVCSGAGVETTMPPPVSFGMTGNTTSNILCEDAETDGARWDGNLGLHAIDSGTEYDQLTGCIGGILQSNQKGPIIVKSFAAVRSLLPKTVRKQLKALAKTHRFVRMKLQPTKTDPGDQYDIVLAITDDGDGKPRVTTAFARLVQDEHEGE